MVLRLITAPIRAFLSALGLLLASAFFLVTLAVVEVVGVYYYLRSLRPAALDRLRTSESIVADLTGILLSVDVILVMLGLVVVNVLVHYLAQTTDSGMGGE